MFQKYIGKNILAWLSYYEDFGGQNGGTNKRCHVYPRFLMKGNTYEPIDSKDFPTRGSIEIRIQGSESAEELYKRVGALVSVKINGTPSENAGANNYYSLRYSYQHGRESSEIWIEPFSGKNFYQVIDVGCNIETLQTERSIPLPAVSIYTNVILLRYEDEIYGPFEFDAKADELRLHGCREHQYAVGVYEAMQYNDEIVLIADQNDNEAALLLPKASLASPMVCARSFDWISDENLMEALFGALRSSGSYTRDQMRQIREKLPDILKNNEEVSISEARIQRIHQLLDEMISEESGLQEIVQYVLDDPKMQEIVAQAIVKNHFDLVKDKITEYSSVQGQIIELEGKKVKLEEEIQNLTVQIEQKGKIPQNYQDKMDELSSENEHLKSQIALLQEKLKEINGTEEGIKRLRDEYNELQKLRDKAKEKYDQQVIDNNELERRFKETLDNFSDKAKQTARVLDSKLLDRILRSIDGDDIGIKDSVIEFDKEMLYAEPIDAATIIEQVANFIRDKAHREVTLNDVANYLICISQGFITTFAGEPGTGKTSLCNILAKALGLAADTPQNRFVDISVERGWSSLKDFIGYYNPLTKRLEESNAEVFEAFQRLDRECGLAADAVAPFIILLDEANLSPIEHYWAAFLRNCDFGSFENRTISLGGEKTLKLPEHLRFLATVNFDHTTEELSPRFLDRSWVIMLEPGRIDDDVDGEIENSESMVSFENLMKSFGAVAGDAVDESVQIKWNALQKIFKDNLLPIMPRNQKMVKNYCAVACKCMERDTPVTKLAPLDYAFSQKILPTINGSGDNYRKLIDDLMIECTQQNMPISARHLERMKYSEEKNMGFYQFFAR